MFKKNNQMAINVIVGYGFREITDPFYLKYLRNHYHYLMGNRFSDKQMRGVRAFAKKHGTLWRHVMVFQDYSGKDLDDFFVFTSNARKPIELNLSYTDCVFSTQLTDVLTYILELVPNARRHHKVRHFENRSFNSMFYVIRKIFGQTA